jgi:hypothetical protein
MDGPGVEAISTLVYFGVSREGADSRKIRLTEAVPELGRRR